MLSTDSSYSIYAGVFDRLLCVLSRCVSVFDRLLRRYAPCPPSQAPQLLLFRNWGACDEGVCRRYPHNYNKIKTTSMSKGKEQPYASTLLRVKHTAIIIHIKHL